MSDGDKCWVYWIRLPEHTDFLTEGYIGITNDLERRFKEHKRVSDFVNAACVYEVLVCGGRDYCLKLENKMRPSRYIGWNVTQGGCTEQLEHLSKRAKGFYSTNYNKTMTLREWAHYLNVSYDSLRKFAQTHQDKSFDYILQNLGKRKESRVNHFGIVEEALFYLENTAMRPTSICKLLGWQDTLQDVFAHKKLPNNLLRNCKLPIYNGQMSIWIKRQQSIWDFEDLNTLFDMWEAGEQLIEMSKTTGYSTYTIKKALTEIMEMRYV